MKKITKLGILFFSLIGASANAQTDTLFLINEKIPCSVKEVTSDEVRFTYLNEEIINTVYKNTVQKIVFKSGRVQEFASLVGFKEVKTPYDYENVTITHIEGDIKGLQKIGEVSSIIEGGFLSYNRSRIEDKALKFLKMKAAMMGSNVVYIVNQASQGLKVNAWGNAYNGPEASLSGSLYTTKVLDASNFKTLINNRTTFKTVSRIKLWKDNGGSRAATLFDKKFVKDLIINNITTDNNEIYVHAKLKGASKIKKFKVVNLTENHFVIHYEDRQCLYNVKVPF